VTRDNVVVGGLAFLLVVSTLFNASNAQAIKQEELVAKVAAQQMLEQTSHIKIIQKYKNAKSLNEVQCKELLSAIGFEGKALKMAWTVAQKESNCRPMAINNNSKTGDNSYGIFQINMIGELGEARLEKFNLDSKKELLDPVTNAKIAFHMSAKGADWSSWTYLDGERFKALWAEYPSSKNN
jgi:hypothetical protein